MVFSLLLKKKTKKKKFVPSSILYLFILDFIFVFVQCTFYYRFFSPILRCGHPRLFRLGFLGLIMPLRNQISLRSSQIPSIDLCSFSLLLSHFPVFPTPSPLPSSPFYSLLLIALPSLSPHFAHIPIFIRILRDPHDFRRFPWNLFQTPNSVRQWFPNGIIRP